LAGTGISTFSAAADTAAAAAAAGGGKEKKKTSGAGGRVLRQGTVGCPVRNAPSFERFHTTHDRLTKAGSGLT